MHHADMVACSFSLSWRTSWFYWKWLRLLKEMVDAGVNPVVESYNIAIKACGKGGQWKEGLR